MKTTITFSEIALLPDCFQLTKEAKKEFITLIKDHEIQAIVRRELVK